MKRLLVVAILAVGLLAVARSSAVDRFGMAVADGQPPPPPVPPMQGGHQKTPWLTADGQPPPPPPPHPPSRVQSPKLHEV